MRVTNMVPDIQYQMQQSEQTLSTALQQVSTSKRVNTISDDPAASATMVRSLAASAAVDRYTSNVSAVRAQSADAALSSVVTALNQAVTLGTQGANSTANATNRLAIAAQVQGILSTVVGQANADYQGSFLFGGLANLTPPFVGASTSVESANGSVANPLTGATALTPGSTTTIFDSATGGKLVYTAAAGDNVNSLASAVAGAVAAGTLSAGTTAGIDANGKVAIGPNGGSTGIAVTTSDAVLGGIVTPAGSSISDQYIYVGNSTVNSVQVGDSTKVQANISGDQVFTSGTNVLGSLNALIAALKGGKRRLSERRRARCRVR